MNWSNFQVHCGLCEFPWVGWNIYVLDWSSSFQDNTIVFTILNTITPLFLSRPAESATIVALDPSNRGSIPSSPDSDRTNNCCYQICQKSKWFVFFQPICCAHLFVFVMHICGFCSHIVKRPLFCTIRRPITIFGIGRLPQSSNIFGQIGQQDTGCFFHWYPPKKYGNSRLGESTLT